MNNSTIYDLDTPSLLLDYGVLMKNIQKMQKIADKYLVNLRPHIKTHKCPDIGRIQMEQGAVGLTSAKPGEAGVFVERGFSSITLAYPQVRPSRLGKILGLAKGKNCTIRLIVDSEEGVVTAETIADNLSIIIPVFLKINVGLNRCGVDQDDPRLMTLAQKLARSARLDFRGLLSHAGQAYQCKTREEILQVAHHEQEILTDVKSTLEKNGIGVEEISVGSTPTVLVSDQYESITEIRPGNYVFMDRTPLRFGLIEHHEIALSLLATIVSKNRDYFVIDAGSKMISSDAAGHGFSPEDGFGLVYPAERFPGSESEMILAKLSEEHGLVKRGGRDLSIGSRVRIIPNHACVVSNLSDWFTIVEGEKVIDRWRIAARGLSR